MATPLKVLGNMMAQVGGKFLSILASLVVVKIVTGFGPEFYGDYVTAYEFLAFFGIIADAGLFTIAVREMSQNKDPLSASSKQENTEFILSNIFSMRLLLIVGVTILAGVTAQFIPMYSSFVKVGVWITGLSMALTIVAGTLSSVLQARMKIQYFSLGLALGKILLAGLIFLIAQYAHLFDNIFYTMLGAGVISNTLFCGLVWYAVSREVRIRLGFDFDWWKKTLRVSLPYGLALILQTLYLRVDIILISLILGSSAVGIYGASTRILESFLILGVFFGQSILPKLSAEESEGKGKFERTLVWGIEILLLLSLPIVIGSMRYSTEIIRIIAGSEDFLSRGDFIGSDGILTVLILTVFFAYLNQLFSFALVAKNRQNYLLYVNGGALLLNAILNILFLRSYGIIAAAISTIVCEIFVFGLLFFNARRYFQLPISWKNLSVIAFANVVLFLQIYLTPIQESFTIALALGSLSYGIILFFFRKRFLPDKNVL